MFAIAAINDTDSREQWEPLAPTKEAQEFHLTQTYHDGLLKLQSKEYHKARQLLESVLQDPLITNAQVDSKPSDDHLLQLRFLALKNLATVFLQQGSLHYENALHCYLQAVEIDTKDSVVWNQLGTLSCSMGLLSISRWAFEQGLLCSPNNWNCMEKLLEVLIAIGDEVACLSVAELIVRHWPSHLRALHVKNTITNSEPIPFAPRGIDRLEPKHARLKFLDKRKATDDVLDGAIASKNLNKNVELHLPELSWVALAVELLGILYPLNSSAYNVGNDEKKSGDVRIAIHLPRLNYDGPTEKRKFHSVLSNGGVSVGESYSEKAIAVKQGEPSFFDEQPHERRSSRLERLRSRKPGKEELDFTNGKDMEKVVIQFLEPFIVGRAGSSGSDHSSGCSVSCPSNTEHDEVSQFVRETSKNYGVYHLGHLLLEKAANRGIAYQDSISKLLELEKLTRYWGQDRTPECSLFLAELYYDLGSFPSNSLKFTEFMSEASFHLCKIIESVALDYPFHSMHVVGNGSYSSIKNYQENRPLVVTDTNFGESNSLLSRKNSFWIRFFWLSGKLSIVDGNKAKAYEELCISLSLLTHKETMNDSHYSVQLPHLKINSDLTINRILYEINLLKLEFLLEKTIFAMIEKEMYQDCIDSLAPLILSTHRVYLDALPSPAGDKKAEGLASTELLALDILLKACEKTKPMDLEVYLNSHRRKLQFLIVLTGVDDCKLFAPKIELRAYYACDTVAKENVGKHWNHLLTEEVKAISQCVLHLKTSINDGNIVPLGIIGDIQSLLVAVMRHIATNYLCKGSSVSVSADETEQKQTRCFLDAVIAFCKLQHLVPTIPIKTQVELIVAIHDLLAEYGICCVGEDGEEGTFLRFAIKHLLALDMKMKSCLNFSSREDQHDNQLSPHCHLKSDSMDVEMGRIIDDVYGETMTKGVTYHADLEKCNTVIECEKQSCEEEKNKREKWNEQPAEIKNELADNEREELELTFDNALDQCFFCLYGLNLRSDSSYDDDLAMHRNTSRGDYQTKEQCADVFQYILPYAKGSSRSGLVKLRRVLRAIRKHFPQPPEEILAGNAIDNFLDDTDLCEEKLSEEARFEGYLETITKLIFSDSGGVKQHRALMVGSSEPYSDIYCNLYYFLALSEEMSASDKWPGFVLTKEGEEFVQQNANLFKYDLLYNPLRFESWQRLANIYDEEVDLLLNDGSKHINVIGWKKNDTLPQRVETSRRRSRRCLLMSLALAKTSAQQCEIHELLALVYYDSLQNVVPFYDQRSVVPSKDTAWMVHCENSLKHFTKAFSHRQDWSHAFYMGKLCEKLGHSRETSLSYYDKAIALNPSAVDPVYRMHASRLKLLFSCGKQNLEALKVISRYSFSQAINHTVMNPVNELASEMCNLAEEGKNRNSNQLEEKGQDPLEDLWHMLYNDCLSALEICIEGDLKHFHKARYMLAQGLYKRGLNGDLERAKDELSFCFKSSRSSFTINMWEIDGMVKKGRRKTPGVSGNKKSLEVNLPESSRKFITCIRKYLLFYLKLLEETGDICTLDRAFISLRADKRFSLCIEDLVPVALGRLIKALISSINQAETAGSGIPKNSDQTLEKMFSLFIEQGNLWPELLSLPEMRNPDICERNLYGYLQKYIVSLEWNCKVETLETINEKIRKRFKNPRLSNSNCAKVCQQASIAWCRSLIISLALITPWQSGQLAEIHAFNLPESGLENSDLLFIDLQMTELWGSSSNGSSNWEVFESKWSPILSRIKNIMIRKVSDENYETANSLLRSSYNFYRESSCVMLPSGLNLYLVPSRLATEKEIKTGMDGVENLDLSIPRKLLLWAYTLLYGRCSNISVVVKYCEETMKSKIKKGAGNSSVVPNTCMPSIMTFHTGGGKDSGIHGGSEPDTAQATLVASSLSIEHINTSAPPPMESQKGLLATSRTTLCSKNIAEGNSAMQESEDPSAS
ncbi:hypothetical protein K2173_017259 [Erythroxylum novogranatense]|uniref:Calcineurin-binding protein 1 n=1 Tax=Erythroxylum novogranatense TaxID=1862640 RepID=A0AAV8UAG6_9ROSI|nr:hypothetical protein K2173_017259 [Erythroxylum novogranatense]